MWLCDLQLLKRFIPKVHLEIMKGNRKSVYDYIKKNYPYEEKDEKVICITYAGLIDENSKFSLTSKNKVMNRIEELIEAGVKPNDIFDEDIRLRKEELLIKKAYFAKCAKEIGAYRKVEVYWCIGKSSSGKTREYERLCQSGNEVYFFSDFSSKGVGGMDQYAGEDILFIDNLKPKSLPYGFLLTLLDDYVKWIRCRYTSVLAIWNKVYITTLFTPESVYAGMVDIADREKDSIDQLLRRIDKYVYYYVDEEEYKTLEIDALNYTNYQDLVRLALKKGKEKG